MNSESEIRHLLDLMPASGRMSTKLISKPDQRTVIEYRSFKLLPRERPISINFELWGRLSRPKRDLLLLQAVSWLGASNWFQPNLYQGVFVAGLFGTLVELVQADPLGVIVSSGLSAIATVQIWRNSQGLKVELAADEAAIRVAQRRGYTEKEAAQYLLAAIQNVAQIENRSHLDFNELIRCQNLRAIAGLAPEAAPENLRQ